MSQSRIISICQRTINSLTVLKRVRLWLENKGALKKKNAYLFQHQCHRNKMDSEYLESCLNLCSRKWLRPRRSLVRYLIPWQLWQLNTLFGNDLINFNKLFLKTLRLAALRRLESYLFHSTTVDGKNFFWKSYV